ncbi:MAG: hypothetical protein HC910_21555 [Spirulinaceae cyanobacterium SM2_1_0]|nr:hypothetical protein [Spirulinaceae cyanobacterium SM2_1_0]
MTAFNTSDIPSDIDTMEKLAVWVAEVMLHLNGETRIQDDGRNFDIVAQGGVYQGSVAGDPDQTPWYHVIRLNLPLLRDYRSYDEIWDAAQEISTESIPSSMKTA